MDNQDNDPIRDVLLLMMVRMMPEDDFSRLCETIHGGSNTPGLPLDSVPSCPFLSRHDPSRPDPCDCCGERVEPSPETRTFRIATGLPACKACIDAAIAAMFGEDVEAAMIARVAFDLMIGGADAAA
jgi:hypothetical protein